MSNLTIVHSKEMILIEDKSDYVSDVEKRVAEIQKLLEKKMTKEDVLMSTSDIHQKLEKIQDRLTTLKMLTHENEAPGTKHRFLKGVKCISCHKDAFMKTEESEAFSAKFVHSCIKEQHLLTLQQPAAKKKQLNPIDLRIPSSSIPSKKQCSS